MKVSPLDAAREALDHTTRHLFPLRPERWLALGFVAFLDQLGRGGGLAPPTSWGEDRGLPGWPEAAAWLGAHVGLAVVLAALVLALVVLLAALVLWLGSRGVFMYMDDVATGRADVARPWREHAERAASLFAWRFGLALAALGGVALLVLPVALVVGGAGRGRGAAFAGMALLLVLLPLLLLMAVAASLASLALRDFVAPIQWRMGVACGEAVRLFLPLVRAQPAAFVVYVLLKVLFFAVMGGVLAATCCLCCCALVPVLAQTLLQPAFFFERAWSLYFLRQLGYDVIGGQGAAQEA